MWTTFWQTKLGSSPVGGETSNRSSARFVQGAAELQAKSMTVFQENKIIRTGRLWTGRSTNWC